MNAIKFEPNRVWRAYLGGAGIDCLRGTPPGTDGRFPEDWIASCVEANNPQYDCPGQGLSRVDAGTGEMSFRELLAKHPEWTRPAGSETGILMKILDSAERLPIQVHPSVENAKRYFRSTHGKTECWIVLGTRAVNGEDPYLLLGFNPTLDRERFLAEARTGVFDSGAKMLHKLVVKPGDAILVPGGTPHAIGPGVTVIEVMEPSDLVVQPELRCGEQPLSLSERFSGAAPEDAFRAFDFLPETEAELKARCFHAPEELERHSGGSLQRLIPLGSNGFFEVRKLLVNGSVELANREKSCRAGVVTAGELELNAGSETLALRCGDGFFLPANLDRCTFRGRGETVLALPDFTK